MISKFRFGLIAGAALGVYIASTAMTSEQRRSVAAKTKTLATKARNSTVGESIADNTAAASDAAQERVADVVDGAGDAVADAMDPDQPTQSASA